MTLGCTLTLTAGVVVARPALAQRLGTARSAVTVSLASVGNARDSNSTAIWRPPVSRPSTGARVALQFVAASAGAAGAGLGAFLVTQDIGERRVEGDAGYTRAGNVGYLVGSMAGATFGAHLVGQRTGGQAPVWTTVLGALVGTVPLFALGVDEPYLPLFGVLAGWIPQAALATGAYALAGSR